MSDLALNVLTSIEMSGMDSSEFNLLRAEPVSGDALATLSQPTLPSLPMEPNIGSPV